MSTLSLLHALALLTAGRDGAVLAKEVTPLAFFLGSWHGEGAFSNGKPIQADATFTADLNGHWLVYRHDDRSPNIYHATTMWGFDASTKGFEGTTFDNFGGKRLFTSAGWDSNRIVWLNESKQNGQSLFSHFIFTRLDENTFQMAYEVQVKDKWLPSDSLTFKRRKS